MFRDLFDKYDFTTISESIHLKTLKDVDKALKNPQPGIEDFKALLSPAAIRRLETMAIQSSSLTQKRFGKTIQLYAPLYLSNECKNICTYCGFSYNNKIKRKTLTDDEILAEGKYLKKQGFNHLLLVTGEEPLKVGISYILNAVKILHPLFANISIEVQPLREDEYRLLKIEGISGVLVYQETYNKEKYSDYHLKGKKSNFYNRLAAPDNIGNAGIHKIGLGALIGLSDWRTDNFFTALHLSYLEKKYWQSKFSISFPRLRPIENQVIPFPATTRPQTGEKGMEEKELVQLICAWRIFNHEVELSLSTRESQWFRNNIIPLGITTMSAGSRTNPGGYTLNEYTLEQFEIDDKRTPSEIEHIIKLKGYKPVWKDWEVFA